MLDRRPQPMTPRDYQLEAMDAVDAYLAEHDDNPCVVLPTGCHAAGTPILMADGTLKSVEQISVGDHLMGDRSETRTVVRLHRGRDAMHVVRPTKGEPFTVNAGHILTLRRTAETASPAFPCHRRAGELIDVSVAEWLGWPRWRRHIHKLVRRPVDKFSSPAGGLLIPPYLLGVLLGDGDMKDGCVGVTTADEEIAGAVAEYAESQSLNIYLHPAGGRSVTHRLTRKGTTRGKGHMQGLLRRLGLYGCGSFTKFVPHPYKVGARTDRLDLLAGLIDTDGSLSRVGFDYVSASTTLASDVAFIARSLGLAAYVTPCFKSDQHGTRGLYHRVSISGHTSIVPCRLRRKQAPPRLQKKSVLVTGFEIEPAGEGDYFGFEVDGDHRYLMGDFTLTHNSGKTPVMAWLAQRWLTAWPGTRILVLAHVPELLAQGIEKLREVWPTAPAGVYSAKLKGRDMMSPILYAGIQSIYDKAFDFEPWDVIFVDEAHRIPLSGEATYRRFLRDAKLARPHVRVVGWTATPYRLAGGAICHRDHILNAVCYEVGVRELIDAGHLCRLRSKAADNTADVSGVKVRGGDFVVGQLSAAVDTEAKVRAAVAEAVQLIGDRQSVLFFCITKEHAHHVSSELAKHGFVAPVVCDGTPDRERAQILADFKERRIRGVCNINVLSEGFDARRTDGIVMLRPTESMGLYYQQAGRALRTHPDKEDALIIDFSGNVERHGPIDALGRGRVRLQRCGECKELYSKALDDCPACGWYPSVECDRCGNAERLDAAACSGCGNLLKFKVCGSPACGERCELAATACEHCGYAFPPAGGAERGVNHGTKASGASILSVDVPPWDVTVNRVEVDVHRKAGKPASLQVTYYGGSVGERHREWVCLAHAGYAGDKARQWWRKRFGEPVPATAEEAVATDLFLDAKVAAVTRSIRVKQSGKYTEILSAELNTAVAAGAFSR
jgi:superfamily II DNA or RNA helicase